jgi:hypothetical protein
MNGKSYWSAILRIVGSVLLSGCVLAERSTPTLRVLMSNPPGYAVAGLGETVVLTADTYGSRVVPSIVFIADGLVVGEVASPRSWGDGYSADVSWVPAAAGEYQVQALAGPAISPAIRICVIDFAIPISDSDWHIDPYGYTGPCPIPAAAAGGVPGAISMGTRASPESIIYSTVSETGETCAGTDAIAFQATVNDPPLNVGLVIVDVSVYGSAGGRYPGETLSETVVLTPHSTSNPAITIHEGSAGSALHTYFVARFLGDAPGEIEWTARALDRSGAVLLTDGPHTIPAEPCRTVPLIAPFSPTQAPTATLTATPASEKDCPPGTYFAPATNRCIPIQIVPRGPEEDGDGGACVPPPGGCTPNEYWSSATCSCQVLQ